MLRQIVVEAETIGASRTMFRLRIDANIIAEGLTRRRLTCSSEKSWIALLCLSPMKG